jgi:hypothetical protein
MAKKSVLAIGIDPSFADFGAFPGLTAELVGSYIETQIERLRTLGFEAQSCLIDLGDTAEAVAATALRSRKFDCVVIGAGLREPPERLHLFETGAEQYAWMNDIVCVGSGYLVEGGIAYNVSQVI